MKKSLLSWSLTAAEMFAFSISVFAQHGASGTGAGRPAGVGPGSTGAPSGVGPGTSGRPTDVGSTGMAHSSMGSQSPTSVLDNGKLNTSLTNALAKGGISVPGGNLQSACSGFKTLGQCIAAMCDRDRPRPTPGWGLSFTCKDAISIGSNVFHAARFCLSGCGTGPELP